MNFLSAVSVNTVLHNTLWVPGHFHFYLLLGVLPMVLAFMYHLAGDRTRADSADSRLGFATYLVGGLLFVFAFLAAGAGSVPRRFAVHLPEWMSYAKAGSIGAILVIAATLIFSARIIVGLWRASRDATTAHAGT